MTWEVIKSVKAIDDPERCPSCYEVGQRIWAPGRPQLMGVGDGWNKDEFNHAFGKVINSKADLRRAMADAKARGNEMIEVGSEPLANIHRHAAETQAHKSKEGWRKVSRELGLPED